MYARLSYVSSRLLPRRIPILTPLALTIAFRWFAVLFVVYTIAVRLSRESWNTPGGKPWRWSLRQPDGDGFLLSGH